MSPYQYGANNPVLMVDINGDSLWITHRTGFLGLGGKQTLLYENGNLYTEGGEKYQGKVKGYLEKSVNALDKIRSGSEGEDLISELQSSEKSITISRGGNAYSPEDNNWNDATNGKGTSGNVSWSPIDKFGGPNTTGGTKRPNYIGLGHELAHGLDAAQGTMNGGRWFNLGNEIVYNSEKYAVHWENKMRAEHNLPLRSAYSKEGGTLKGRTLVPGTRLSPIFREKLSVPSPLASPSLPFEY